MGNLASGKMSSRKAGQMGLKKKAHDLVALLFLHARKIVKSGGKN
jgi:hypothetical protein